MARIVQSTTLGDEKDSTVLVGEQVKSTVLYVVRVCTPKDRRSWIRFLKKHKLWGKYSVVEKIGRHPVSNLPRAIAISLQATQVVHDDMWTLKIVYGEKQEFTRWDTFQSTKVAQMGSGGGPAITRKIVPARLQFMTPKERADYLNREPLRTSYHVGNPDILMGEFIKLLRGE